MMTTLLGLLALVVTGLFLRWTFHDPTPPAYVLGVAWLAYSGRRAHQRIAFTRAVQREIFDLVKETS